MGHKEFFYFYTMKQYILILSLLIYPSVVYCQEHRYSYDDAVKKIVANTWWYYKDCQNDSCYLEDSTYFYAELSRDADTMNGDGYETKNHIQWLQTTAFERIKDFITGAYATGFVQDLIPSICFIDTVVINNTYQICTVNEDGFYKAQLKFTSDNEFFISRINTYDNKFTVQKFYYKLRSKK